MTEEILETYRRLNEFVPRDIVADFEDLSIKSSDYQKSILRKNMTSINQMYVILFLQSPELKDDRQNHLVYSVVEPKNMNTFIRGFESPRYPNLVRYVRGNLKNLAKSVAEFLDATKIRSLIWKGIPQIFNYFSYDSDLEHAYIFYRELSLHMKHDKFMDYIVPFFSCCAVAPFLDILFRSFFVESYLMKSPDKMATLLLNLTMKHLNALSFHHLNLLIHLKYGWANHELWRMLIICLIKPQLYSYWQNYPGLNSKKHSYIQKIDEALTDLLENRKKLPVFQNFPFSSITVPDILIIGDNSIAVTAIATKEGLISIMSLNLGYQNFILSWKSAIEQDNTVHQLAPLKCNVFMKPIIQPIEPNLFFNDIEVEMPEVSPEINHLWQQYVKNISVRRERFINESNDIQQISVDDSTVGNLPEESVSDLIPSDNGQSMVCESLSPDLEAQLNIEAASENDEDSIIQPHGYAALTNGIEKSVFLSTGNQFLDDSIKKINQDELYKFGIISSIIELQKNGRTFEQLLYQKQKLVSAQNWLYIIEPFLRTTTMFTIRTQVNRYRSNSSKQILSNMKTIVSFFPNRSFERFWFVISLMNRTQEDFFSSHSFKFWGVKRKFYNCVTMKDELIGIHEPFPNVLMERFETRCKILDDFNEESPFSDKINSLMDILRFSDNASKFFQNSQHRNQARKFLFLSIISRFKWIIHIMFFMQVFFSKDPLLHELMGSIDDARIWKSFQVVFNQVISMKSDLPGSFQDLAKLVSSEIQI